jgi:hypothetical protein
MRIWMFDTRTVRGLVWAPGPSICMAYRVMSEFADFLGQEKVKFLLNIMPWGLSHEL